MVWVFSDEKRSGQQPTLIVSLRDPYTKAIFQENTRRSFQYNLDPVLLDFLIFLNFVNCEWIRRAPFCLSSLRPNLKIGLHGSYLKAHAQYLTLRSYHTDDKKKQDRWLVKPQSSLGFIAPPPGFSRVGAQTCPPSILEENKTKGAKNQEKLERKR